MPPNGGWASIHQHGGPEFVDTASPRLVARQPADDAGFETLEQAQRCLIGGRTNMQNWSELYLNGFDHVEVEAYSIHMNASENSRLVCHTCGVGIRKKPSDAKSRTGRPYKHTFCDAACYARWRADRHNASKRDWLRIQREVWGTTEAGRFEVGLAKHHGRRAEVLAKDRILPFLGFSEIDDLSGYSNQFFVDFIATYRASRVLVDATIKLKAYVPEKLRIAAALRMPLYILHISIKSDDIYWLSEARERPVSRVPAAFIRSLV